MAEGKKGFFGRLVEGLTKTRNNIVSGIDSIFSGFSAIDDDFYEEIEETLIMGDLGIQTTMAIVEDLRNKVKEQHIKDPEQCKEILINSIQRTDGSWVENAYVIRKQKVRCPGDRCQWRWKDYFCRKTGRPVKGPGQESDFSSSRYLPCSSN